MKEVAWWSEAGHGTPISSVGTRPEMKLQARRRATAHGALSRERYGVLSPRVAQVAQRRMVAELAGKR